jgi:hypothetical protein
MTIDEAKAIVEHEPWRWREVWDHAARNLVPLYVGTPEEEAVTVREAIQAANLVRLLVPLTAGCTCGGRCYARHREGHFRCVGCGALDIRPHGRDVLELYVRALRLAKGDGWLEWFFWEHPKCDCMPCDAPTVDPVSSVYGRDWIVYDDGTVECSAVCPELPEVT